MAPMRVLLLPLAFLLMIPLSSARAADLQQDLTRLLATPCLTKGEVGMRVAEVAGGKVLFDSGGEKLLIPASNVKLLLAAAALSALGPTYAFPTEILTDRPLSAAGALRGNVYLKGYGDPVLVSEQLWLMARALKHLGLSEIRQDLIADDGSMLQDPLPYAWNPDEESRAYTAKPGALSLNFNTVQVTVDPARETGAPPRVQIDPDSAHLAIDNQAITARPGTGRPLRVRVLPSDHREILQVRGAVSLGAARVSLYRSVEQPALYTARVFAQLLHEAGIALQGVVRRGTAPPGAELLYTHRSKPLALILQDMNKWSNNFIAEQLLRTLGSERYGRPGTRDKGVGAVQEYLAGIGIGADAYQLEDGSGLSRGNRLSAAELVAVLEAAVNDSPWQAEYMASLGLLGLDGVVERGFAASPARGLLRVKTGFLDGVRAFSGYGRAPDGKLLAFSLLWNGSACSAGEWEGVQANFAALLAGRRDLRLR